MCLITICLITKAYEHCTQTPPGLLRFLLGMIYSFQYYSPFEETLQLKSKDKCEYPSFVMAMDMSISAIQDTIQGFLSTNSHWPQTSTTYWTWGHTPFENTKCWIPWNWPSNINLSLCPQANLLTCYELKPLPTLTAYPEGSMDKAYLVHVKSLITLAWLWQHWIYTTQN